MHKVGNFTIGQDCVIESDVEINVANGFLGDRSILRSGCRINGTRVEIGHEAYLDHGALIGGGSCFDACAYLKAGDFLHMGERSQVNIARGVDIGNEVGIGIETKIFTHSAYLSSVDGFPVKWAPVRIGDRVWLPCAQVHPGVMIGSDVVVAAMSLVNKDLPAGCFAGGIPVKILKEYAYPKKTDPLDVVTEILAQVNLVGNIEGGVGGNERGIFVKGAFFDLVDMIISGPVSKESELVKSQLRRNGLRFRYFNDGGEYKLWKKE